MLTYEEQLRASNRLNKMSFYFEQGGMKFETFWNRIYLHGNFDWNYKEHRHSFYEVHICMQGKCEMTVNNENIALTAGTFLVIPPQKPHKINNVSNDFSKFVLGVRIEPKDKSCIVAVHLFEEGNTKPKIYQTTPDIVGCINSMLENANSRLFNYYDIIKTQLYCLIVYIMRQSSNVNNYTHTGQYITHDARVDAVKNFITDNLPQKFTNESIARQFNISSRQLSRILMETTGMTLGDLKRDIQVDCIRNYLKNTDYSLKEIATRTGFYDEFSMSKVFKRIEGMPPGEYRKGFK